MYRDQRTRQQGEEGGAKDSCQGQLCELCLVPRRARITFLCKFGLVGTAVLGTWDPCGVIQEAAVRLHRHSIYFVGMRSKSTLDVLDLRDIPLLRLRGVPASGLNVVIEDGVGNRKKSHNQGAGRYDDNPGLDLTMSHTLGKGKSRTLRAGTRRPIRP